MAKKAVTDHLGNKFSSITEMCKYWGVNHSTFCCRIKKNLSLAEALTGPKKVVTDHLGNNFESVKEMCEYWGVNQNTFSLRLQKKLDLAEALTGPKKTVADHLGNLFISIEEMCKYWGVDSCTFRNRLKKGLTLTEALTGPKKVVIDHLGNEFGSIEEMCEHWGVPYITFKGRIREKWTMEKALTTPVMGRYEVEYNGVHYNSARQLALALGISVNRIIYYLNKGKSVDDIIKLSTRNKPVEYNGRNYESLKELAKAFGISYGTFTSRRHCKKSLDEALQSSERPYSIACTDLLGVTYSSIKKLSEAWRISAATVKRRIKGGFDIEVIITAKDTTQLNHIDLDGKAYYKVQWSQDLVTARQIVEYYRPDLIEAYDKNNPTGKWNPVLKENQSNQEENKDGRSDI